MDLAQHFVTAVSAVDSNVKGPELLPVALSRACVAVLPVEGASLSMTDELRVPLGASDEAAARAERLQVTLGEGPCLAVTAAAEPQTFDLAAILSRWPMFATEVLAQTPFRSVSSIPLSVPDLPRFGALDLFCTDPAGLAVELVHEVATGIGEVISAALFAAPTANYQHGVTLPTWLNVASVTQRMNVWVAVGMLMENAGLDNSDALALLRAYAFGRQATLDDIARQVTNRELALETVLS